MKKHIWKFEKKDTCWFIKEKNKSKDYYVRNKNSLEAKDWDLVEFIIFKAKSWKNKEAKIKKILTNEEFITKETAKNNEWIVTWIYSDTNKWFWFVDVEGREKGYFVYERNKLTALDWDMVEAKIKKFKWKEEAEITKVIKREKKTLVGKFQKWKTDYSFVLPKNKDFKNDIFVLDKNSLDAKDWDLVAVEIYKWDKKNPEWKIKEILAKEIIKDKKEEDIISYILEWGARIKFYEETLKESENLKKDIKKEIFNRKNLRDLFTFTIDSIDARDLDDAISLELLSNWDYKLYVHIADVTHYVKEDSHIDKEALERWTSVYLADRVLPMLPQILSNDLCSLNPWEDKLTLTCEMIIWWKTGHIISSRVYESMINSNYRLTYKDVDMVSKSELKEKDILEASWIINKELIDTIEKANNLKKQISEYRKKNWVLDFDFKETKIILDEEKNVLKIWERTKYDSSKMIELFMVSANESVAKEFSKIPFLYRVHEKPSESDILALNEKLNIFWISFQVKENTPLEFEKLLDFIEKNWNEKTLILQKIILRTLSEAYYSPINKWHFGLGLKFYSHFTSPIRRYPDLQIHRIIKEVLNNSPENSLKTKREIHYKKNLPSVALESSTKERQAQKIEYKINDFYIVSYYKDKIWEEFDAYISWMIPKGIFVALNDNTEWFIEFDTSSSYDDKLMIFINKNNKYTIGDKIKVKLIWVDKKLLRLNFWLI